MNVAGVTALHKEDSIHLFLCPMALFVVKLSKLKQVTDDSGKDALGNRMWLQMDVALGPRGHGDNILIASGGYFRAMSV